MPSKGDLRDGKDLPLSFDSLSCLRTGVYGAYS